MISLFIKNTKKGYTLAEALITLAVLGALAAISMPMLHNVLPDKYDAMYKKASFALENTTSIIVNDDYLYTPTKSYTLGCVKEDNGKCTVSASSTTCCIKDNHCVPAVSTCSSYGIADGTYKTDVVYGVQNTQAVDVDGVSYSGNKKFCQLFARRFNLYPNTKVRCHEFRNVKFYNDGGSPTFISSDGIQWLVPVSDFKTNQPIAFKVAHKDDTNATNCAYLPSTFVGAHANAINNLKSGGSGWVTARRSGSRSTLLTEDKNECKHPDTFVYIITPEGKLIKPEELTDKIKSAGS